MTIQNQLKDHRFAKWGGNPKGNAYAPERCCVSIYAEVWDAGRQCSRKSGHGTDDAFCWQHRDKRDPS